LKIRSRKISCEPKNKDPNDVEPSADHKKKKNIVNSELEQGKKVSKKENGNCLTADTENKVRTGMNF